MNNDENRYKEIIESMIEGYYESDLRGNIIFCNRSFCDIVGIEYEKITGANFRLFVSDKDVSTFYKMFNKVFRTGESEKLLSWEFFNHAGEKKFIDASIVLVRDERGEPLGFRGVVRDITGYRKVQEALRESENRYSDIVESLPEIVFELDGNGTITYTNNRALEILGYTREELIGMNAVDMIYNEEKERAFRGISNTLLGKRHSGKWFHFRMKDGRMLPMELYTNGIFRNGRVVGIRGIAIDISLILESEKALRESEEKFRTLIEHSSEIIGVVDINGFIKFESNSVYKILGYTTMERIGTNALEYVHPEDREAMTTAFMNGLKDSDSTNTVQYRYRHKNGSWKYLETTGSNLLDNALIRGIILNSRDITEQRIVQKSLMRREEKFRSLYNNALVAMITIDRITETIVESNDLGYRVFGYETKSDLIGTLASEMFANPNDIHLVNETLRTKGYIDTLELQMKKGDGTLFWAELSAKPDYEAGDLKAVIVDITKRKHAEELVRYYTFHDQLTGLPNREMFMNRLQMEIVKAARREHEEVFCVMCLGIDRFKNINEMHGPIIGDKLLKKIAERLRRSFRQNDLVSRFTGDQFTMLFSDLGDTEGVIDIVQKTFNVFADPFIVESSVLNITPSIGVSIFPNDGETVETLIKNAESAMYLAKEKGRNTYNLFDAKMYEEILARLKMEQELQYAIYNNEFVAYYQPKVNAESRIVGMESLIRWNSKHRGLVLPHNFINMAEKNGMIETIGNLMLYQSCMQNKRWQEMGYPAVRVAVNLSPYQFKQPNLIDTIEKVIRETSLDPHWLELEITESGIMDSEKSNIDKLFALSEMGIAISIDDFGTGYSSFSKLKDFPINTLKVDKSFIENLPHDRKSAMITTAIIELAHNLGFNVVAEGVSTKEQYEFLAERSCDHYQGFYFYEPLESVTMQMALQRQ